MTTKTVKTLMKNNNCWDEWISQKEGMITMSILNETL